MFKRTEADESEENKLARPAKSETGEPTKPSAYKIGDKHKFALHLLARQGNANYTQVLETAIDEKMKKLELSVHWLELWDTEPSVRTLNMYALTDYKATTHEEHAIAFIRAHAAYFYSNKEMTVPRRPFAVVLWPNLKRYMKTWTDQRAKNYYAAAEAMDADLKKAKLEPPKKPTL